MDETKKIEINFGSHNEKIPEQKKKSLDPKKTKQVLDSHEVKEGEGGGSSLSSENQGLMEKETPERKREGLEKLLEEKEAELRQKHDRLLRALAEYENYKKRVSREKADLLKFGNESLIKEILPVIDNFDLSLEHARKAKNSDTIIEGIEMVKKEFLRKLEKFGLKVISTRGEKFDPTMHEAASLVESADYPENTIVEELKKGYLLNDRLLRPAMVIVAKSLCSPGNESPTFGEAKNTKN